MLIQLIEGCLKWTPPRVRKNNLRLPDIQIGLFLFNLPPVYPGMAETADRDTAHRRADSPLLLVLFCILIRYAYIIGALCMGYSCSVGCCSSNAEEYNMSMALFTVCALLRPNFSESAVNLSAYPRGKAACILSVFSAMYRALPCFFASLYSRFPISYIDTILHSSQMYASFVHAFMRAKTKTSRFVVLFNYFKDAPFVHGCMNLIVL